MAEAAEPGLPRDKRLGPGEPARLLLLLPVGMLLLCEDTGRGASAGTASPVRGREGELDMGEDGGGEGRGGGRGGGSSRESLGLVRARNGPENREKDKECWLWASVRGGGGRRGRNGRPAQSKRRR